MGICCGRKGNIVDSNTTMKQQSISQKEEQKLPTSKVSLEPTVEECQVDVLVEKTEVSSKSPKDLRPVSLETQLLGVEVAAAEVAADEIRSSGEVQTDSISHKTGPELLLPPAAMAAELDTTAIFEKAQLKTTKSSSRKRSQSPSARSATSEKSDSSARLSRTISQIREEQSGSIRARRRDIDEKHANDSAAGYAANRGMSIYRGGFRKTKLRQKLILKSHRIS